MINFNMDRLINILKKLCILFCLFFVLALIVKFLVFPELVISKIFIETTLPLSNETILEMGEVKSGLNYFLLDEKAVKKRYESYPNIRKAYIEKKFPQSLKIVLYERSPIGILGDNLGSDKSIFYFDSEGVLFKEIKGFYNKDYPLLYGIDLQGINPGDRLNDSYDMLYKRLGELRRTSPVLFRQISEIHLFKKEINSSSIRVIFNFSKVPVLMNSYIDKMYLKKIILVLTALNKEKMVDNLEYVDFRSPQIILKQKEVN